MIDHLWIHILLYSWYILMDILTFDQPVFIQKYIKKIVTSSWISAAEIKLSYPT